MVHKLEIIFPICPPVLTGNDRKTLTEAEIMSVNSLPLDQPHSSEALHKKEQ